MKKLWNKIKSFASRAKLIWKNSSTSKKTILGLLAVFLVLNALTITWGMFNFFSWSPDDVSGFQALAFAKFGRNKYPPLETIIDLILYAPVLIGYWLAGIYHPASGYPYGFVNPHIQMGILIMISRSMVFIYYLLTGLVVYLTFRRFGKNIPFWAAILYILSPIVVLFSTLGNVYSLMMLWVSLSLIILLKLFLKKGAGKENRKLWMLFFLFLGLAAGTKEEGVFIFVLPCLATIAKIIFSDRQPLKELFKDLVSGFAIFVGLYLIINRVIFDFSAYQEYMKGWFDNESRFNKYPLYHGWEMAKKMTVGALLSSPILCVAAAVGFVVGAWRKEYRSLTGFIALGLISRFIFLDTGGIFFLRHSLPTLLFLSVFAGIGMDWLFRKRYCKWLGATLVVAALAFALSPVVGKLSDSRYAEEKLILETTSGKSVHFFTDKYHFYMPRIRKITEKSDFKATDFVIDQKFKPGFSPDLYITEPKYYTLYKDDFAGYRIIYQTSEEKQPYYYRLAPNLNACRISCPIMILEKEKKNQ